MTKIFTFWKMCDNWIVVLLSGTSALNKNIINSQVYFKKIV